MVTAVAVDERLSVGATARALGVSAMHVRRLILAGQLPATKTTLGYLVSPVDVQTLKDERGQREAAHR